MTFESLTEYQRQFIGDINGTFEETYRSMLRARNKRKSNERSHTPLIWVEIDGHKEQEKEKTNSRIEVLENSSPPVVPLLDKSFSIPSTTVTSMIDKSEETKIEENGSKRSQSVQTNFESEKRNVGIQSPCRQRPWNRPKSFKKALKLKKPSVIQEKPIILYGWADNTSLQKKKTYNVKAPVLDVQPTALSAARRREEKIRTITSRKEKLNQEKIKTQVLIDSLTNFGQWQTEYQTEFNRF